MYDLPPISSSRRSHNSSLVRVSSGLKRSSTGGLPRVDPSLRNTDQRGPEDYSDNEERRRYLGLLYSVRESNLFGSLDLNNGEGHTSLRGLPSYYQKSKFHLAQMDSNNGEVDHQEAFLRHLITSDEAKEWQTINELAGIHYVTFILVPFQEKLFTEEHQVRSLIREEESEARRAILEGSDWNHILNYLRKKKLQRVIAFGKSLSNQPPTTAIVAAAAAPVEENNRAASSTYFQLQRFVRAQRQKRLQEEMAAQCSVEDNAARVSQTILEIESAESYLRNGILKDEKDEFLQLQEENRQRWEVTKKNLDRRLHLERLVYWRAQTMQQEKPLTSVLSVRVEDDAFEAPLSAPLAIQSEFLLEKERQKRRKVESSEEAARILLLKAALGMMSEYFFQQCVEFEADLRREQVQLQLSLLPEYESLTRQTIEGSWTSTLQELEECETRIPIDVVNEVEQQERERAARIIQSTYRQHRQGRIGASYSHRLVGREIAAKRDAEKITKGKKALNDLKYQLEEEEHNIEKEMFAYFETLQNYLFGEEGSSRLFIVKGEERESTDISVAYCESYYRHVVTPIVHALWVEESEARRRWCLQEEIHKLLCHSAFTSVVHYLEKEESASRDRVCAEESMVWASLYCEWEQVVNVVSRLKRCATVRSEEEIWELKTEISEYYLSSHWRFGTTVLMSVYSLHGSDDYFHRKSLVEHWYGMMEMWQNHSASCHQTLGETYLQKWVHFLDCGALHLLVEEETCRNRIAQEYSHLTHQIVTSNPVFGLLHEKQEALAVSCIETAYLKYRQKKSQKRVLELTGVDPHTLLSLSVHALLSRTEPRERQLLLQQEELSRSRLLEYFSAL